MAPSSSGLAPAASFLAYALVKGLLRARTGCPVERPVARVEVSPGLKHQLFVLFGYGALICDQKACSHLDAGSAEHKGGRHAAAVGNTAGGHDGNVNRIDNLRDKCHRRGLANMAARFGALGNHGRGSATRHEARQRHRGHDRE